ncbi:MAG: translation initiation factor IF-2 [Candidatus Fimadaptatus sp.]|jgi:translation initiation factor IF-2
MAKVKVQDATKEVSSGAGRLLESVARSRKQAQDAVRALKALEEKLTASETQKQEEKRRDARVEAPVFMNAFSSDQFAAQNEAAQSAAEAASRAARQDEAPAQSAPAQPAPARQDRPAQPEQRPQQAARAPQGDRRPAPQGARPQGPYGRPVNAGDRQGPYGRPVNAGDRQGPYGRPVNAGDRQGPYGRPVNAGDRQGPYGRPAQGGQFGRPAQAGGAGRPQGDRPARPGMGGRPAAGGAPRGGMGSRPMGARKSGPELAPTVEKERVSNYDPNKKNYVRQHDPEHVAKNRRQLARSAAPSYMDDEFVRGGKRAKGKKNVVKQEPIKIEKAFMTAERITVRDLSERIGKPAGEIIKKLMGLDIMATINSDLDYDTALLVCSDFGIELELKLDKTAEDFLSDEDVEDDESKLQKRPPVITIMGHVDHGKTSLLDYIRKTRVTASEAGGITQHIGAYTVKVNDQQITFLDTPGHEAFTAMRARGAQCTDIAILVVAADDGVMPQTIEAINHAKAAKVPIIVAINKCDRQGADPDRIKTQLTEYGLVCEDWGGDTIMVPISALTGDGIDSLLEMVILQSEVLELKANPDRMARGIIVEARLDKGRGPVATVLVQNGTLHTGDTIVAGTAYGRVRAMVSDRGERVNEAGPSTPVEVIGFNDVPEAGDQISAVEDDRLSRLVAEERKQKLRAALVKNDSKASLDDLFNQIGNGVKDLNVIIKADVQGSVEAVKQSLEKLSNEEVQVKSIHGGVGAINETDVMLASASNAIIVGFNVRPDSKAAQLAERDQIDIRLYRVIYDAIEEIQAAMKGMLAPKFKEVILGHVQVRQTFKVSGVGTVAGGYVTDGKIQRNAQIRLLRDNIVIHEGKIDSLKRFKDDAREVAQGYECGIGIENYNDIKENDVIECFVMEEIKN